MKIEKALLRFRASWNNFSSCGVCVCIYDSIKFGFIACRILLMSTLPEIRFSAPSCRLHLVNPCSSLIGIPFRWVAIRERGWVGAEVALYMRPHANPERAFLWFYVENNPRAETRALNVPVDDIPFGLEFLLFFLEFEHHQWKYIGILDLYLSLSTFFLYLWQLFLFPIFLLLQWTFTWIFGMK